MQKMTKQRQHLELRAHHTQMLPDAYYWKNQKEAQRQ